MPVQLRIIPEKCIRCQSCELVCSLVNEREINPDKSRISVIHFIEGKYTLPYNLPLTCRQCADAPCLHSCPVGAISRKKNKTKIIAIDYALCIKCGRCVEACPFGAMFFVKEDRKPFKCELCGGEPACASICPTGAIRFVQQKPFYSKAQAFEREGSFFLSQRNRKNVQKVDLKR